VGNRDTQFSQLEIIGFLTKKSLIHGFVLEKRCRVPIYEI